MLSGAVAALAGVVISLRNSTAAANVGQGFELTAVAAVVLGGVSIFGGRGTLGVVLALVLLGGIQNAADARATSRRTEIQSIVTGLLLIVSVLAPQTRRPRSRGTTTSAARRTHPV